jgi:hypothetical protein
MKAITDARIIKPAEMTQTPIMPPSIEFMNIMHSMIVLEPVGKISEEIRLAEDEAGDANRNANITTASRQ